MWPSSPSTQCEVEKIHNRFSCVTVYLSDVFFSSSECRKKYSFRPGSAPNPAGELTTLPKTPSRLWRGTPFPTSFPSTPSASRSRRFDSQAPSNKIPGYPMYPAFACSHVFRSTSWHSRPSWPRVDAADEYVDTAAVADVDAVAATERAVSSVRRWSQHQAVVASFRRGRGTTSAAAAASGRASTMPGPQWTPTVPFAARRSRTRTGCGCCAGRTDLRCRTWHAMQVTQPSCKVANDKEIPCDYKTLGDLILYCACVDADQSMAVC